jgi:hypothetical protein
MPSVAAVARAFTRPAFHGAAQRSLPRGRRAAQALGRRRAVGGRGAVGDLERGVRCDRRAVALGALYARQGQKRIARSLSRTLRIRR